MSLTFKTTSKCLTFPRTLIVYCQAPILSPNPSLPKPNSKPKLKEVPKQNGFIPVSVGEVFQVSLPKKSYYDQGDGVVLQEYKIK